MKTLVIGANGQLGTEILRVFEDPVIPLTHEDIEISDYLCSKKAIEACRPHVLINTAAYHHVLDCEKNPQTAFLINAIGVKHLAHICQENEIRLVHISTDYVFDGRKKHPYDEDDVPHPLNVYGISKLAGEFFAERADVHYVIRISSLFGKTGCRAKGGTNFVKTMLHCAKTKKLAQVTSNIIVSPTYAYDAAVKIKELIDNDFPSGVYHISNSGSCSWYKFAAEIFSLIGSTIKIEKKEEKEEVEGIARPLYSPLLSHKIKPLRHWKEALKVYLKEEGYEIKEGSHD